ncbi:hypothetical protein [Nocardioides taihuensis]|uniref:Uncharacterized protein n=1 Tax=Nocardioides taihuensis TaxID=1835606 RepID=A0ABW0BN40_9ACTN
MRALCLAGGGTFHLARFGGWRCQDATLDGMGTFWAERTVCEQVAHRSFAVAPDPTSGRGTWLCLPVGD